MPPSQSAEAARNAVDSFMGVAPSATRGRGRVFLLRQLLEQGDRALARGSPRRAARIVEGIGDAHRDVQRRTSLFVLNIEVGAALDEELHDAVAARDSREKRSGARIVE